MKLPTPSRSVNVECRTTYNDTSWRADTSRRAHTRLTVCGHARHFLSFAVVLSLLSACGPLIAPARFSVRPDTVKPGSNLGPFNGVILDGDNHTAIANAIVVASWSFTQGIGQAAPKNTRVFRTASRFDGRYEIPALQSLPTGMSLRLAQFSLIIYKPGYVAYRHDFVFNNKTTIRRDFTQRDNRVSLVKWSPELSHAKHLLFLGGDESLRTAAAAETVSAAEELDGLAPQTATVTSPITAPTTAPTTKRNEASHLLSTEEIRSVTGYKGAFTEGPLSGATDEDSYHFSATAQPERYDIAIRLWRSAADRLTEKFESLKSSFPVVEPSSAVGDDAFVVSQGEIYGLGMIDKSRSAVVLLTCGSGQCPNTTTLIELGRHVELNLQKLPDFSDE